MYIVDPRLLLPDWNLFFLSSIHSSVSSFQLDDSCLHETLASIGSDCLGTFLFISFFSLSSPLFVLLFSLIPFFSSRPTVSHLKSLFHLTHHHLADWYNLQNIPLYHRTRPSSQPQQSNPSPPKQKCPPRPPHPSPSSPPAPPPPNNPTPAPTLPAPPASPTRPTSTSTKQPTTPQWATPPSAP